MDALEKWKRLKEQQDKELEELREKNKLNLEGDADRAIDGMYQNNMY